MQHSPLSSKMNMLFLFYSVEGLLLALWRQSQFGANLSLRLSFNKMRAASRLTYFQATGSGLEVN